MTPAELDEIERAVGFSLPSAYRALAGRFPFRPVNPDWVYWFYDDPNRVIENTIAPLEDGGYDPRSPSSGWKPGFLTIGEGPAGDAYVMDTRAAGLPMHLLSHETLAFEFNEWPDLDAFVEHCLRTSDGLESNQRELAEQDRLRTIAAMRQSGQIAIASFLACLVFLATLALLVKRRPQ